MSVQADDYVRSMQTAMGLLRVEEIASATQLMRDVQEKQGCVYCCGNGGSASTASHLAADLRRNVRTISGARLPAISLTDNVSTLTALSNDICFEDCFVEQLLDSISPKDLLIGISASGDSENIVRAFQYARQVGASRMAVIGFDGGRLARLATRRIWIDSHDYGIVESIHLFVVHLLVTMASNGQANDVRTKGNDRVEPIHTQSAADLPTASTLRCLDPASEGMQH